MNCIEDDIGKVVTAMQTDAVLIKALTVALPSLNTNGYQADMPYYMAGHRVEISNRLLEKDADPVYKYQKYPLVALRLDTPEKNRDGMVDFTLNIAILMFTDRNWNADERLENVFKPVLFPLYDSFLRNVINVGLFTWPGLHKRPVHTKYNRYYWGTEVKEGNTANIFSDPLDAIELIDLKLTQLIKC